MKRATAQRVVGHAAAVALAAGALSAACADRPQPTELVRLPLAAELPPSVTALDGGGGGGWRLRFRWRGEAGDVRLTGDFTGWSAEGLAMAPTPGGGAAAREWAAEVALPGIHRYKLVVDGDWRPDPENPHREPDGFEGQNSRIRLGPDGLLDPGAARLGDRRVDAAAIRLGFSAPAEPAGAAGPAGGAGPLVVRLETLRGDATAAWVGETPFARRSSGSLRDHWEAPVWASPGEALAVRVADGGAPVQVAVTPAPDPLPVSDTPAWARHAVWYQILPDRFRNGDPANDPPGAHPWAGPWIPEGQEDGEAPLFPAIWSRHFGGDLAGVTAGLGHVASLGVDAIYLNPIHDAPSPHRYDAASLDRVDPELGGDAALAALVEAVHARGMRIVLDGVFNHVGETHPAAVDARRRGAASPYARWFERAPDGGLAGWSGHRHLPVLAHDSEGFLDPSLERHLVEVTRRYIDPDGDGDPADGVDGWRLDVADELPAAFWARWRAEVRRINPEAVVIGEVWRDAPRWTEVFHGVTDYGFAAAIVRFAEGGDAATVAAALANQRAAVSLPASAASWTLVGSHDTDRVLSRLFNPGRGFDQRNRTQDGADYRGGRPDDRAWERARLAAFLQATLPGSPLIWQGDEVGVWGADDPHNRRPMPWPDAGAPAAGEPTWNAAHLAWYRTVFDLRRRVPSLRDSPLETIATDGGLWVYRRGDAIAAVNASDEGVRLPPIAGTRLLGDADDRLGPRSVALWATGEGVGPR